MNDFDFNGVDPSDKFDSRKLTSELIEIETTAR